MRPHSLPVGRYRPCGRGSGAFRRPWLTSLTHRIAQNIQDGEHSGWIMRPKWLVNHHQSCNRRFSCGFHGRWWALKTILDGEKCWTQTVSTRRQATRQTRRAFPGSPVAPRGPATALREAPPPQASHQGASARAAFPRWASWRCCTRSCTRCYSRSHRPRIAIRSGSRRSATLQPALCSPPMRSRNNAARLPRAMGL